MSVSTTDLNNQRALITQLKRKFHKFHGKAIVLFFHGFRKLINRYAREEETLQRIKLCKTFEFTSPTDPFSTRSFLQNLAKL